MYIHPSFSRTMLSIRFPLVKVLSSWYFANHTTVSFKGLRECIVRDGGKEAKKRNQEYIKVTNIATSYTNFQSTVFKIVEERNE